MYYYCLFIMIIKNHKIILNAILSFGVAVYFLFALNGKLSTAVISLILFMYFWIIGRMYFGTFKIQPLLYLISGAGILFSKTYFFIYGVEEVPFPEGAVVFHSQEIAISLIVFFISTIFLLYVKETQAEAQEIKELEQNKAFISENSKTKIQKNENWEEATLDDLNSGNFEVV